MRPSPLLLAAAGLAGGSALAGCGLAGASTASSSLPACSTPGASDYLAVVTDSASERSTSIFAQREQRLAAFAAGAAACRGHLLVVLDPGETLTRVLYSGTVSVNAATDTAYRRRAGAVVHGSVIPQIDQALRSAESAPAPQDGTPVSAFQILAEDRSSGQLDALVLTDMVQVDSSVNLNQPLTSTQAQDMADTEAVPSLRRAQVAVVGVGVTADSTPAPGDWLAAVRTFAATTCRRTGASCAVDTQTVG